MPLDTKGVQLIPAHADALRFRESHPGVAAWLSDDPAPKAAIAGFATGSSTPLDLLVGARQIAPAVVAKRAAVRIRRHVAVEGRSGH
jgi:hypothetical protein